MNAQWQRWKENQPEAYKAYNDRKKQMLREERLKFPLKHIDQQRKSRYGITAEQFAALLVAQNNCCAICECNIVGPKLAHVDHDHDTKKVRGLLCIRCNRGIGLLKDDANILKKAANYLDKS